MSSVDVCAPIHWVTRPLCYATNAVVTGFGWDLSEKNMEVFAEKVLDAAGNSFANKGSSLGEGASAGSKDYLKGLDIPSIVREAVSALKETSKQSIPEFEEIAKDFTAMGGRIGWNALKTYLPITLASMIATSGVFYGIQYLYKKAEDSIGKPRLAAEVRYYNLVSRVSDTFTRAGSSLFKTVVPGAYAALCSKAVLIGAIPSLESLARNVFPDYIPSWFTDFGKGIEGEVRGVMDEYENPIWHILPNVKNALSKEPLEVYNLRLADRVSLGMGAFVAGSIAYSMYKAYIRSVEEEPKGIFSKELKEVIDDVTHSAYNIQKNKGFFENVLLYGPGGTGKTMIAKMIAKNSGMNYVMMSGGDLAQYIKRDEHVTELNKLMERAKHSQYPTVLFIDEAESLACDRDKMQSAEHVELLNAFLNHTGEASKKLMVIMATNRLEDIDPAVLSRMDQKVHITPPAAPERKQILELYIEKFFDEKEQKEFFTKAKVDEISVKIDGFTGRAIFKLLNAIAGKKSATEDNKLTNEIIDQVVNRFVEQERVINELRNKAIPVTEAVETSLYEKIKAFFNKMLKSKE